MMLRFLFLLTTSLSSGTALAVFLIALVTYFCPDPTAAKWQAGRHAQLAKVPMRTTPQAEPVGRPTQAPAGAQEVSEQRTSPAADIRSLPPSEGIPGLLAEQDMGDRMNAHTSEQPRSLGSAPALMSETSLERGPVSVAIGDRNAPDQEQPQTAPRVPAEQTELAVAALASVISQGSNDRTVTSQNDNSTVAASVADDDTKIEPPGQAPSSTLTQRDRPATAESSAHGSGGQQQSTTQEDLNRNKPSVAEQISIHYRRDSVPARVDAQRLASWLASSGFSTPRLLTTGHGVASPVVRYFFKEDAEDAALLARALRSRDGSWRAEDCRRYRRKPPAGTIEVWPPVRMDGERTAVTPPRAPAVDAMPRLNSGKRAPNGKQARQKGSGTGV